jgi:hypothetical protein
MYFILNYKPESLESKPYLENKLNYLIFIIKTYEKEKNHHHY